MSERSPRRVRLVETDEASITMIIARKKCVYTFMNVGKLVYATGIFLNENK